MEGAQTTTLAPGLIGKFWIITLGKKVLMAVSGAVLIGFATGHMVGNLQLFIGQEQLNKYAYTLQNMGVLLWFIRAFMVVWLILHVWNGIRLYFSNRAARPVKYNYRNRVQSTFSSRVMIWTGLGVISFVIYHLLHFTFITTNPAYRTLLWQGHRDVYSMVILGFQNYVISAVYIIAIACLAFHLRHAVNSMFQTMGWNNGEVQPRLDRFSVIYAWVVFVGYVSMPIAVMLGLVSLPGEGI